MVFRLGLNLTLLIAVARVTFQLTLLGILISLVLSSGSTLLMLLLAGGMIAAGGLEAASRPNVMYDRLVPHCLVSVAGGVAVAVLYAAIAVFPGVSPSHYLLPLVGLLVGSVVNGVSAGLAALMAEVALGRPQIELMLALGASRDEAARGAVRSALQATLGPVLSQLSLVGLIGVPSLMAGQLLASGGGGDGDSPHAMAAARLQLVVALLSTGEERRLLVVCC
ncbi:hypothetical protein FOA52_012729 [Chlamydomonas sp. UWO 241]|nr:hypothetical protein FOA52_012729 [Chlamydomonas sp. UWO 241]